MEDTPCEYDDEQHQSLQIRRDGHRFVMTPEWVRANLSGQFYVRRLNTVAHETAGCRTEQVMESLLCPPNGERRPNVGLRDALCMQLGIRDGAAFPEIYDVPFSSPGAPALSFDEERKRLFGQFFQNNIHGIIKLANLRHRAGVIAALNRRFPNARIVMLANHQSALRSVAKQIDKTRRARLDREKTQSVTGRTPLVFFNHAGNPVDGFEDDSQPFPRIIGCTPLQLNELEPSSIDFVILLDASEVVDRDMRTALCKNDAPFRLFAFEKAGTCHPPYLAAHISAAFGFCVLDLIAADQPKRFACVEWIDNRQNRINDSMANRYQIIIHNERRNRRISQIAKQRRNEAGENYNVSIVVDDIEHAFAIGQKLRDWPIITAENSVFPRLSGSKRRRISRDRARACHGQAQIIMTDAMTQANFSSDILIWAAGGNSPTIPLSWLAWGHGVSRYMLVIDFRDRFNAKADQASRKRKLALEKQDIVDVAHSGQEGRALRFIQEHWRRHDQIR